MIARKLHFLAGRKERTATGRQILVMRPGVIAGILLQLFVFGAWSHTPAFATALNASWEYQLRGGDEEKTQDRFLQRYHLSTGFTLEPTDAVTTGANIAYSRFTVTDLGTNETLTPSANLQLSNDIFIAELHGTLSQTHTPSPGTLETYSWGTSLSSSWQRPFLPTLRFYYDETGQNNDAQSLDLSESTYGSDLTWILPAVTFFYGFNQRHAQDQINLGQVDSTSHTARLETGGSLFDKRLTVKLSETFNTSSTDTISGEGGKFFDRSESTPLVPAVGSSDANAINLVDASFPVSVPFQEAGHLGVEGIFDFEGEQQVDQLRVGVDPDTALRVETGQVDLQWALYISRDNQVWELVPGQGIVEPTFINDGVDPRFEIVIPDLTAFPAYDFLKVVVINQRNSVDDVVFTSLKAFRESQASEQTTYQTDLSLGYRITSTLLASSTMNLLFTEGRTNRNLQGSLKWDPSTYMGVSLGVSENLQQSDTRLDQIDRTYTLTVPINPLPTLTVTPAASRSESYDGSRKTSLADRFSLNAAAAIYPDLKGGMSVGYTTSETEELIGQRVASESMTGRLNLIAKITRQLNADLSHSYSQTLLPSESTSQESALNLNYRPSDILVTRLLTTKTWTGDAATRIDFRLDLALLRTYKTRVNFNYRHLHAESDSDAFALLGAWDISQIFSLQSQARYLMDESNSWTVNVKLLMNL